MKRTLKRVLSLLLVVAMLIPSMTTGLSVFAAQTIVSPGEKAPVNNAKVSIIVPETIYLKPSTGTTTESQYFVNNNADGTVKAVANETVGKIYFNCPEAASLASVSAKTDNGANVTVVWGTTSDSARDISTITLPSGLSAGSTTVITWTFVFNMKNGGQETYYAYSVAYAPFYAPVGAATRIETNGSRPWAQSVVWVSGVHSFYAEADSGKHYVLNGQSNHLSYSNSGAYQGTWFAKTTNKAFIPMISGVGDGDDGSEDLASKWIVNAQSNETASQATIRYSAHKGDNGVALIEVSPIAILTVDTSRYNNFNQIPNFTVGYNVTDVDEAESSYWYFSDFTTQARNGDTSIKADRWAGSYDGIPGQYFNTTGTIIAGDTSTNRGGVSDYYKPAEYNGAWNKAIDNDSSATETKDYVVKGAVRTNTSGTNKNGNAHSVNFAQLRVTNVDKSALRKAIQDYTANRYYLSWYKDTDAYIKALKAAYTALGNPLAAQVEIDSAKTALDTAYSNLVVKSYNITFDNMLNFLVWKESGIRGTRATISNITNTGFTITSNEGNDAYCEFSPNFAIEAGKTYVLSADITGNTSAYEMFVDLKDTSGVHIEYKNVNTTNSMEFTAPANCGYVSIRFDANNAGNIINVDNIRLREKDSDANAVTVSKSNTIVKYNESYNNYDACVPTRDGYAFLGWYSEDGTQYYDAAGKATSKNTTVTDGLLALHSKWEKMYTVTWQNYDGTVLGTGYVKNGATATYTGSTPTKPASAQYSYEFNGWSPVLEQPVTSDTIYIAQFKEVTRAYTVRWENYDGTELKTETVEYGKTPTAPENPTRPATDEFTYTFTGWDKPIVAVTGDTEYTAQFSQTTNKYKVTWVIGDRTEEAYVDYGTVPTAPTNTTKPADKQYTYTFTGWDKNIVAVTGDVTYTAQFSTTTNTYTVEWVGADGTVLEKDTVEYGKVPTYDGATPTKASNAQYSYEHLGWTPEVVAVTGHARYEATFTAILNKYTVTWNVDGKTTEETYDYGAKPSYKGDTPTKPADDQYTYTFAGWNPAIDDNTTVTGPVTYTAVFDKTVNKYTIKFVNEDGSELQSSEFEYGATPVYTGSTPTKAATAQYTYTFDGWTTAIEKVTGEATYTAKYKETVNKYTIKFVNEDGTELQSSEVAYGETPEYKGAEPTKAATAQYTYVFTGWDPAIASVTGEATYTAQFESTTNVYTVTWENYDGTVLETDENVPYGTTPEYNGATPTKPQTDKYEYTFADKWSPEVNEVTGDVTYTAQFTETVRKYTITWKANGQVLKIEEVEYDTVPVYVGETPTKEATAEFTYTFADTWKPAVVAVTGNATYEAEFDATVNTYTVTWVNDDDSVLETDENVPYGAKPSYDGATPTKAKDAQFTYTFDKWVSDSDSETVTGTVTYKATYTTKTNTYTVTWKNENGIVLETDINVPYGATPSFDKANPTKAATAQYTYTFAGWTPEVSTVTGDATYTATYTAEKNKYTITWKNDDSSVIDTTTVEYGVVPTHADPTKASTAEYNYTFAGWTPAVVEVTGDATYTATFNENPNVYTITWTADGETVKTATVAYGAQIVDIPAVPEKTDFIGVWVDVPATMPAHDIEIKAEYYENGIKVNWVIDDETTYQTAVKQDDKITPDSDWETKAPTVSTVYTFKGWSETKGGTIVSSFPIVTENDTDKTYYAVFEESAREYTITWANDNGTTIKTESVAYGETPEYVGTTPTKTATAQYTYTFKDWSPAIAPVTEDATYTATYTATVNEYTITWKNADGTELKSESVAYGETPAYTGNTPVKTGDEQYSYVFTGWTPAIVDVTEDATYTATFQQVVNEYTVKWVVEGTTVETDEHVPYGTTPTFNGTTPTKAADAQYTYTFAGWDPAVSAITGDTTYTATFDKTVNKYTVTWANDDGSVIKTEEVEYGTMASYTGETPTKEATAQYTFTFDGWDKEFAEVKDDVTYTAKYTETLNKYTVTWVVEGVTVETDTEVEYGATPSYDGEEPTKEGDAETSYTFAGWTPAIEKVTDNVTYTATFTSATNTYTVTWIVDGVESTTLVEYGKTPEYDGTPTKAADAQYTYEFAGWDPVVDKVTGDATYTAVFTKTDRLYTITWIVDGKTTTEQYKYNEVPSFKGSTDKPSTEGASYVFAGWDKELANVTADETYTAKYDETIRMFTITWIVGDQEIKQQWAYGTVPSFNGSTDKAPSATATYTFAGWDKTPVEAKADATYTATYTETARKYTVVWYVDGQFFATQDVAYNTVIPTPGLPAEKEGYSVRWDNTVTVMPAGDVEIHAIYTPKMYPVYWIVDGLTVYSASVPFGSEIPSKAVPAKEGYTGKWVNIPETMPAGIVTIEAEYTARSYQVFWKIGDAQSTGTATYGTDLVLTFDVAELPEALRITINNAVIPEDSYNYDSIAGTLTIYGSAITGNVSIVARSTSGSVNVINSIFGGSSSNTNDVINMRTTYHTTITPDSGNLLPKTVKIYVDGILITEGYSYDATSGRLTINAEVIIGELEIYAECDENPDYNPSENCDCSCHSKNVLVKFFYEIFNFLRKLFGMEKYHYCECGVSHW